MAENVADLAKHYQWCNADFFHEIISKEYPDETISIENVNLKPALKFGENYASQMVRAIIQYRFGNAANDQLQEIRFVIKALLINEKMAELTKEYKIFDKEIIMYEHILPAVEKLLAEVGDHSKLAPRCYKTSTEDCYIVFEDLGVNNFKNIDRRIGLQTDHYKLLLTKIAKWHACTAVMLSGDDFPYFKEFETSQLYTEDIIECRHMITNPIISAAKLTGSTSDNFWRNESLSQKLFEYAKTAFPNICQNAKYTNDPNSFNVLAHGDLWSNNIMFSFAEHDDDLQQPTNCVMVDYQIPFIGSPVVDLAYVLFASSHNEILEKDWDYLLKHYHTELRSTLIKLNYSKKMPTFTDIQVEFLRKAKIVAPICLMVVGLRQYEDANEGTINRIMGVTEEDLKFQGQLLENPLARERVMFLLDYYDRKGMLE